MSRQENYPSTNLSVRKPPPGDNQSQLQFSSQGQPGSTDQQTSSEDDRALLRELGIYSGIVDESYNLSNQNPDSEAESKVSLSKGSGDTITCYILKGRFVEKFNDFAWKQFDIGHYQSHESVGKGPDCPEGWAKIQLSDDDKNESPQYTCLTEEQVDDLRNYARNISGSDTN